MSLDKDYLKDLFTDEVNGCLKSDGDPVGTAASTVSEHNTSEDAHSDIRGLIDLDYNELRSHAASDKHITPAERIRWNAKSDFSGSYNDLSDKPTIPTVPTQVSAFNNDAGYLTQHQDISGKANSSDLTAHTGNSTVHITAAERTKWNQAVTDVGNLSEEIADQYAKKSAIPTKVSQLTNDSGYLTEHQDLSEYAKSVSLIDSTSQAQANLTPAEILQAVQAGKILMAIGGVCTLMSNSGTSKVVVHRQYNDSNIVAKITINSDKSYAIELINLEKTSNKVTSLSASSTDTQYPSAKCVYDMIGNVEALLSAL